MRIFAYGFIVTSALLAQGAVAMQASPTKASPALEKLFEDAKLARNAQAISGLLNAIKERNPEEAQKLCREIKDPGFYVLAASAGVGTIKNRAMVTWCEGGLFGRVLLIH